MLWIIADKVPVAKEKENTPISIITMQKHFSDKLTAVMSP
jgi:hypothetical protein